MHLTYRKRVKINKIKILKHIYYSPESKIMKSVKRYTPFTLSKPLLNIVRSKIEVDYYNKIRRKIKNSQDEITSSILQKILSIYFEWVILKCIQGYRVHFLNDEKYLFFIHPYYPNDVEESRLKHIDKLYGVYNEHKINNEDFKGRKFRLSLYKKHSPTSQYKYTGYYLRLNVKYKRLLEQEIKKNPNKYDHTLQF